MRAASVAPLLIVMPSDPVFSGRPPFASLPALRASKWRRFRFMLMTNARGSPCQAKLRISIACMAARENAHGPRDRCRPQRATFSRAVRLLAIVAAASGFAIFAIRPARSTARRSSSAARAVRASWVALG